MADEEIVYSVKVEAEGGEKSLKELRDEFKLLDTQLGNAKKGSKEFNDSLVALGKTKGEITQLRDTINALNPEAKFAAIAKIGSTVANGFAAATAAAALFGADSEDLQKTLVKVQAATALASGIQGLSGMADALKNAGLAMKAFALSNPFTAIAVAVVALTAAIYALYESLDDTKDKADSLRISNEKLEISTKNLKDETALTTREMAALGRSEKDIFEFRQRSSLIEQENIKEQIENINKLQRLGEITDEDLKKRNELEDRLHVLQKTRKIEALEFQQKMDADSIKLTEEALDRGEKQDAKEKERQKEIERQRRETLKENRKWNEDHEKQHQDFLNAIKVTENQRSIDEAAEQAKKDEEEGARELKMFTLHKDYLQARLDAEIVITQARIGLAQGFLSIASSFSVKHKKIADAIFVIDKALAIASVVVSTQKEIAGYYSNPTWKLLPDGGVALATAASAGAKIRAATSIASIVAASVGKFMGGGGASVEGGGGGGAPNVSNSSSPTIEPPQRTLNTTQVKTNEQGNFAGFGNRQDQRVYVVESDISKAQNKVSIIEQNAKY